MRVIFFDGECNLCNGFVDWLLKADKRARMKVASLQGETARRLIPGAGSARPGLETVVYVRDGRAFERSSAVLMILADLGGAWMLAKAFLIVPTWIRDAIYGAVARNRIRIFGKRDSCRLPKPEERERFLP